MWARRQAPAGHTGAPGTNGGRFCSQRNELLTDRRKATFCDSLHPSGRLLHLSPVCFNDDDCPQGQFGGGCLFDTSARQWQCALNPPTIR